MTELLIIILLIAIERLHVRNLALQKDAELLDERRAHAEEISTMNKEKAAFFQELWDEPEDNIMRFPPISQN